VTLGQDFLELVKLPSDTSSDMDGEPQIPHDAPTQDVLDFIAGRMYDMVIRRKLNTLRIELQTAFDEKLANLKNDLHSMTTRALASENRLTTLEQIHGNQAQTQTTTLPKIPLPEKFTGEPKDDVETFLSNFDTYITLQASSYTDQQKISLLVLLCSGQAGKWATPISRSMQSPNPDLVATDFNECVKALRERFGDPRKHETAVEKINRLKQLGRCRTYASTFETLIIDTDWNERAKLDAFKRGLKPTVSMAMASMINPPTTLREFMHWAIQTDDNIQTAQNLTSARSTPTSYSSPTNYRTAPTSPNPNSSIRLQWTLTVRIERS
jgi:hypothetical protein